MNKKLTRFYKMGALFCLLLILIGFLLPTLASTSLGKQFILNRIQSHYQIPGSLQARELKVSWFGPQKIKDLSWDISSKTVLFLDNASTDASLFQLLQRKFRANDASVDNLKIDLSALPQAQTNFQEGAPKLYDFNLELKEINQRIFAKIQGKTNYQGQLGSFDLKAEIKANQKGNYSLKGKVNKFPTALLDQLLFFNQYSFKGTLAEALGPTLSAQIEEGKEKKSIKVLLNSGRSNGSFEMAFSDMGINFLPGSYFKTNLTPKFFEILLSKTGPFSAIKLNGETPVEFKIEDLFYPWKTEINELITFNGGFKLGPSEIMETAKLAKIDIQSLDAHIETSPQKQMRLKVQGKGIQNEKEVNFFVDAEIERSQNLQDLIKNIKKNAKFQLETTSFPLSFFKDSSLNILPSFLGYSANIKAKFELKENLGHANLSFLSEKAFVDEVLISIDESGIKLAKPFVFELKVDPNELQKLAALPLSLEQTLPIIGEVQSFLFSFPKSLPVDLSEAVSRSEIKLNIGLKTPKIKAAFNNESIFIEDLIAHLSKKSHEKLNFQVKANLEPKSVSELTLLLDKKSQINLFGTIEKPFESININLQVDNRFLKLNLAGIYGKNGFEIHSPSFANYTLTEKAFNKISGSLADRFTLQEPTMLHFTISPLDKTIKSLRNIHLIGNLKLNKIRLKTKKNDLAFTDINIPMDISTLNDKLKVSVNFSGKNFFENIGKSGVFRGKASFKLPLNASTPLLQELEPKLKFYIENAPEELLAGIHPILPQLINNPFNLDVNFEMPTKDNGFLLIKSDAKDFDFHIALKLNEVIQLYDDAESSFEITIDNEKFNALYTYFFSQSSDPLVLKKAAPFKAKLKNFKLPISAFAGDFSKALRNLNLKLDLELKDLLIENILNHKKFVLSETLSLNSDSMGNGIHFKNVITEGDKDLKLSGTVGKILDSEGHLHLAPKELNLVAETEDFPIALLDLIPNENFWFSDLAEGVFGKNIKGALSLNLKDLSGVMKVDFKGDQGAVFLDGQIAQSILSLNSPFKLYFRPNVFLTQRVLQPLSSLLGSLEPSKEPIAMTIDPQGFSMPLFSKSVKNIKMARGVIDINLQSLKNTTELQTLLGLFKSDEKKEVPIWLTPIFVSLNEGILTLYRFDYLLNERFHLASWGRVNLMDNKLDMIIGITQSALRETFGVTGLDADYLIQIPLKGSFANLKLEKKKAAAKISSLVAHTQGPQGMILGTFIDIASGGSDPTPPKPTTFPFPWGEETQAENGPPPVIDLQPVGKQIEKGVDHIEKGAKKLLKKLFK